MNLWTLCVMLSLEAHCPNPWVKLDAENLGTRTGSACTTEGQQWSCFAQGRKGVRRHAILVTLLSLKFSFSPSDLSVSLLCLKKSFSNVLCFILCLKQNIFHENQNEPCLCRNLICVTLGPNRSQFNTVLSSKSIQGGSGWGTHVNPWLFHFSV